MIAGHILSKHRKGPWLVAIVAIAVVLAGCTTPDGGNGQADLAETTFGPETGGGNPIVSERVYTPTDTFSDVHGIGVDAERPDLLYVATHHGLIRVSNLTTFERIGDIQDDYMGLSVHPEKSGTFWVSGHPASGGNMGVRFSQDGGFTWRTLALKGVDFHAMAVSPSDPDRLYGSFQGQVYRSIDGGENWTVPSGTPAPPFALVVHPEDPEHVYLAGSRGLFESLDGGGTWSNVHDRPTATIAIDPHDPDQWLASFPEGLHRSSDAGTTWTETDLSLGQDTVGYIAFDPNTPGVVYAASYRTGLFSSTDGGTSWTTVKEARG